MGITLVCALCVFIFDVFLYGLSVYACLPCVYKPVNATLSDTVSIPTRKKDDMYIYESKGSIEADWGNELTFE